MTETAPKKEYTPQLEVVKSRNSSKTSITGGLQQFYAQQKAYENSLKERLADAFEKSMHARKIQELPVVKNGKPQFTFFENLVLTTKPVNFFTIEEVLERFEGEVLNASYCYKSSLENSKETPLTALEYIISAVHLPDITNRQIALEVLHVGSASNLHFEMPYWNEEKNDSLQASLFIGYKYFLRRYQGKTKKEAKTLIIKDVEKEYGAIITPSMIDKYLQKVIKYGARTIPSTKKSNKVEL